MRDPTPLRLAAARPPRRPRGRRLDLPPRFRAAGLWGALLPEPPRARDQPFAAGGSTDTQLHSLCELASTRLNQTVVVESRPGAGGTHGMQALAGETRPDGHLSSQLGTPTPARLLMSPRPPVDPATDFTWVVSFVGYLFSVVVRANAPGAPGRNSLPTPGRTPGG